jgi:trans-aconitate methyltransferase
MDKHKLFGFTNVDQTNDPDYYIRFLDQASADESFQAYKRHSFALLDLQPGRHVLDVGCGTGEDARAMASLSSAASIAVCRSSIRLVMHTASTSPTTASTPAGPTAFSCTSMRRSKRCAT